LTEAERAAARRLERRGPGVHLGVQSDRAIGRGHGRRGRGNGGHGRGAGARGRRPQDGRPGVSRRLAADPRDTPQTCGGPWRSCGPRGRPRRSSPCPGSRCRGWRRPRRPERRGRSPPAVRAAPRAVAGASARSVAGGGSAGWPLRTEGRLRPVGIRGPQAISCSPAA